MATFIIVDDSKIARGFLKAILVESGHKVLAEASNGEEGYELYIKHMPDIIMIDITMPVLNGLECLKKIRAEFPKARAIMVTAVGSESKREAALIEGAMAYIVKPIDPEVVADTVERCLRSTIK